MAAANELMRPISVNTADANSEIRMNHAEEISVAQQFAR